MIGLRTDLSRLPWMILAVIILLAGAAFEVSASKLDLESVTAKDDARGSMINLTLGKGEVLPVQGEVSDILVANPSVVEVKALNSGQLYAVGIQVGDTNIMATDARGEVVANMDIHVRYDVSAIQKLIENLFPYEDIEIGSLHDQIFLRGTVTTPEVASRVTNVVGHYVGDLQDSDGSPDELIANLLNVRGEQQVMLRVKIVEASRRVLKELGVETNFNDLDENAASQIFSIAPPQSIEFGDSSAIARTLANFGLSEDPVTSLRLLGETGIRGIGMMEVIINALEEHNMVNVLAEPNLTAISGEKAGFLAGGEFPVPVGRDQYGNITIEMMNYGVSLNFNPLVLSEKRISLQMDTEVSSLNYENAVVLAGITVPGLDVRRASTTVELPSGGSLMIAGLLRSDNLEGLSGIPGINKTPVLGELVKSDSFLRDESELVVIITPYLVEAYREKDNAKVVQEEKTSPLAKVFAANIRRTYGNKAPDLIDEEDGAFGYLLN